MAADTFEYIPKHTKPGAWFTFYMTAYFLNTRPETENRDALCRFYLKIVDLENGYLSENNSNSIKEMVYALLSLHGQNAENEMERSIDRLLFWTALDEMKIIKYPNIYDEVPEHSQLIVQLVHCLPEIDHGEFISRQTVF